MDTFGEYRADPLDPRETVCRGVHQRVDGRKLLREQVRIILADMRNAEPGQHPRQAATLAGGDTVDQVLRRLLAHPLQFDQLLGRDTIKIWDRAYEPCVHQLLDDGIAKSLDIHGGPGREE